MKRLCLVFGLAAALIGEPAASAGQELTWTGCGVTRKAFMAELALGFEAKTGIKVNLSGGGATKGIRLAASGMTDVGGSCRHRLVVDGIPVGVELRAKVHQVAWDALVPITHPDNPVDNISTSDLKKIYNGRVTSWSQVGGSPSDIVLVTRKGRHSGVGQMFRILVFGYQEHAFLARSIEHPSTGPLEEEVESRPYTLAMDGVSSAKRSKVKILSLDGIEPTKENIASGKYPLFRPLYLVTNAKADPAVNQLIEFALSDEGQKIISAHGTVNLKEGAALEPLWEKIRQKYGL